MLPPFDVFRVDADGSVLWRTVALDLDAAKRFIRDLHSPESQEFLIVSLKSGKTLVVKSSELDTKVNEGKHNAHNSVMPNDDFAEGQRKLEAVTLELKTVTDPERRRTLLREMSRLVGETQRISGQPPAIKRKPDEFK